MATEYLGRGFAFPFRITQAGGVNNTKPSAVSDKLERIDMSLEQILGTSLGERVMRPEFGSRLQELVFMPNTPALLTTIQVFVIEAIKRWEKRIEILNVIVSAEDELVDTHIIQIQINYFIIQYQVEGNLVYPFYLKDQV